MKDSPNISQYIYDEYLFNRDELVNSSSFIKDIELLIDNKLATKISSYNDVLVSWRFNLFKFACKKICEYNKDNKRYLENSSDVNEYKYDNISNNKADINPKVLEYSKIYLGDGTYYAELKSKDSDEFMVLDVSANHDDTTYQSFSIYFIGKKCFKNKKKFMKEYAKLRDELGDARNTEYIAYTDGRPKKEAKFKSFDQMVFKDKDKYIKYIDNWVDSIPKYHEYGIIPKLSILLYGEPGTGKSTFCKALAKYLGIGTVTSVSPEYFSSNNQNQPSSRFGNGSKYINQDYLSRMDETIYSIDDIDCIGRSREKDESSSNGRVTSSLLEFLDNPNTFYFKANDGKYYQVAIVCATTNYYDRLDSAVKRFGRFDLTIPMNRFTKDEAEEMCKIYDLRLKDVYHEKYNDKSTFSPAQIQALCMENVDKRLKSN